MLKYNFKRVFRARGIDRPFTFLKKAGFSDNFASKINNNRVYRLDLKDLERLCFLLRCTPHDLLEWHPEPSMETVDTHPLEKLRKSTKDTDLIKTISAIPLEQVQRIENLIKEEIKSLEG
ncbi:helix-turn-helix domain-containing protein [Labilibacter marinus]|uniref:helix-turn-helix domain-containing protein n=1 Tax=Labilibacter marinus TaxID=1477105 RepID=UPI00094FD149|nr:helix-turn-helix transcriptional regulator [Labilibacter marinus]